MISSNMEQNLRSMKRIKAAQETNNFSLDDLNQDLLERVLSWLPTPSFFRLVQVCRRWKSIATSLTFLAACSQVPYREPWLLMVSPVKFEKLIFFDSGEAKWREHHHPGFMEQAQYVEPVPVASAGGVVCFRAKSGELLICNPLTGEFRELPPAYPEADDLTIHAITMNSRRGNQSYQLVEVVGNFSDLVARVFDSSKGVWEEEIKLLWRPETMPGSKMYFLSKTGDVVAADMLRSPLKQFSSVLVVEDGEDVVYFLSRTGMIVACNLATRMVVEYPRLLPINFEHSIDLVDIMGGMVAVVLSEFLETASLRVWRFSKVEGTWRQVAAMPPAMSHELFGKKVDINCVGCGSCLYICVNSEEYGRCFVCDVAAENGWVLLPKFSGGGGGNLVCAFAFQPRLEVGV